MAAKAPYSYFGMWWERYWMFWFPRTAFHVSIKITKWKRP